MLDIYRASAGSGKTYALAYTYIKLLLGCQDPESPDRPYRLAGPEDDHRHRNILAITFTNKATGEMKRRIIHELALLAGMEPGWDKESPYMQDLCRDLNCSADRVRRRAAVALRRLLSDFSMFNVSTIDSFFQTILRTFTREVEVAGDYEINLDEKGALAEAVNNILQAVARNEDLDDTDPGNKNIKKWLIRKMETNADEGKQFNIFNTQSKAYTDLVQFFNEIYTEEFRMRRDEMKAFFDMPDNLGRFVDHVRQTISRYDRDLEQAAQRALPFAELEGVYHHLKNSIVKWADRSKWTENLGSTAQKVINEPDEAWKAKFKDSPNRTPECEKAFQDACTAACRRYAVVPLLTEIVNSSYILGLTSTVLEQLKRVTDDTGAILLSDTNTFLKRIIGNDPTPFIYERIGMALRHYLIDEFQDTSRLQWDNLVPLINESQSTDHESLVIGDEKQCIYRFRNSDPSLLANLEQDSDLEGSRGQNPERRNTNWRSAPPVVRFNNTFFYALQAAYFHVATKTYSNVIQDIPDKNRAIPGCITFHDIAPDRNSPDGKLKSAGDEGYVQFAYRYCIGQIHDQLRRGYAPGDIAALFRTRETAANFIYSFNRAKEAVDEETGLPLYPLLAGVRVVSEDAMRLNASAAVRLVVNTIRVLGATDFTYSERRQSPQELALLLNRFETLLSKDPLEDDIKAFNQALFEDKTEEADLLTELTASNGSLTELTEQLISRIPAGLRQKENVYLTALMDTVADYSRIYGNDIRRFITWWDTMEYKLVVGAAEDLNAIRVMTIHKSKGLEFPCVHLPWNGQIKHDKIEWFDSKLLDDILNPDLIPPLIPLKNRKQLAGTDLGPQYTRFENANTLDDINLLYVALTRAVNELTVCYDSSAAVNTFSNYLRDAFGMAYSEEFQAECEANPDLLLTIPEPDSETGDIVIADLMPDGSKMPRPKRQEERRTAIDPTSTFDMPADPIITRKDLLKDVVIDEEHAEVRSLSIAVRMLLRRLDSVHSLDNELRRMAVTRHIDDNDLDAIRQRALRIIADHPEAFSPNALTVKRDTVVNFGNNASVAVDRLLTMPDGSQLMVLLLVPEDHLDDDKKHNPERRKHFEEARQRLAGTTNHIVKADVIVC